MSNSFKVNGSVTKSPIKESRSGNYNRKKNMVKGAVWEYNSMQSTIAAEEDYMNGFSWPPRSYTCSFCKREFRSAQALGGHMNVHRRDRARLRQSPPTSTDAQSPVLNLNLNPNFTTSSLSLLSSSSSSSTTRLKPFNCALPSGTSPPTLFSSSPPPSSASPSHEFKRWAVDGILLNPLSKKASESSTKLKNAKSSVSGYGEYDHVFAPEDGCKILKKAEIIRLDLKIGLISDSKDDLDLELRLGTCS